MVDGFFQFDEIGILNSITMPLAEAEISLLAISTFDTDYILIKDSHIEQAVKVFERAGHRVIRPPIFGLMNRDE